MIVLETAVELFATALVASLLVARSGFAVGWSAAWDLAERTIDALTAWIVLAGFVCLLLIVVVAITKGPASW